MRVLKIAIAGAVTLAAATGFAVAKDWTTVRIGIEAAYPPFNGYNANHELVGFDYDIGLALCAKMKVECTFVAQDWDGMIPALLAGKFDAIVSSMSITDERKEVVDFTDKYYTNSLTFVAPKDFGHHRRHAGRSRRQGDRRSRARRCRRNSSRRTTATPRSSSTRPRTTCISTSPRAASTPCSPMSDRRTSGSPARMDSAVPLSGEAVVKDDLVGIAIRKEDSDLKEMFNKAIAEIIADGTYDDDQREVFPLLDILIPCAVVRRRYPAPDAPRTGAMIVWVKRWGCSASARTAGATSSPRARG